MTTTGDKSVTDLDRLQQDLAARGVRYFFGAYTDVHGVPKAKCVPIAHLKDAAGGSDGARRSVWRTTPACSEV